MSISSDIMDFIAKQPEESRKGLNPTAVAEATGHSADKVSKLMWSLEHTGRLSLIRDGRSITGVAEVLRVESRQGKSTDSPRARRARGEQTNGAAQHRGVRTPNLDAYARAKERAEAMQTSPESQFIEVVFRENPLAEEGLHLRESLSRLEEKYSELSTQYKMTLYEYEGVKSRMREKATRNAVESGAVATASAD